MIFNLLTHKFTIAWSYAILFSSSFLLLHHINFYLWCLLMNWYYYHSVGSSLPHPPFLVSSSVVRHSPHRCWGDILIFALLYFSYAVPPSSCLLTYYVVSIYSLLSFIIATLRELLGFQVPLTQTQILIYRLYLFINFLTIVHFVNLPISST